MSATTKTKHKPLSLPAIARSVARSLPILLALISFFVLAGCVSMYKGHDNPDGTTTMKKKAEVRGVGRDGCFESGSSENLVAPYIKITRPDGFVIEASNATMSFSQFEKIGASANVPPYIEAGAKLAGAAADLSPF